MTLDPKTFVSGADYLYRNSLTVSFWRAIAVVSGIALDAAVVAKYGLGKETDAFFIAVAIPLVLASTIELEVSKVVVPMMTHFRKDVDAWKYLSNLLNLMFMVLVGVAIGGAFMAPMLIPVQAPGLDRATLVVAIKLNRVLFWLPVLVGVASVIRAALNSFHIFAMPSYTKIVGNVLCIFCVLLFYEKLGIESYCLGLIGGKCLELIILCFGMKRKGMRYFLVISVKDVRIIETGRLMLYTFTMNLASEGRNLVENFLASYLPSGVLSGFRYAFRIIHAIAGTLVGSISVSMLPLAGNIMARNGAIEMAKQLVVGVRLLALVSLPILLCLVMLGEPFISLFFERGRFSPEDTAILASFLCWMSPYIFLSRFPTIVLMPFYGAKRVSVPFLSTLSGVVVSILWLAVVFPVLKAYAIATGVMVGSIASSVCSVLFLKKIVVVRWAELRTFSYQLVVLGLAFGANLACAQWLLQGLMLTGWREITAVLVGFMFSGFFSCLLVGTKLRMEEALKAKVLLEKGVKIISAAVRK